MSCTHVSELGRCSCTLLFAQGLLSLKGRTPHWLCWAHSLRLRIMTHHRLPPADVAAVREGLAAAIQAAACASVQQLLQSNQQQSATTEPYKNTSGQHRCARLLLQSIKQLLSGIVSLLTYSPLQRRFRIYFTLSRMGPLNDYERGNWSQSAVLCESDVA